MRADNKRRVWSQTRRKIAGVVLIAMTALGGAAAQPVQPVQPVQPGQLGQPVRPAPLLPAPPETLTQAGGPLVIQPPLTIFPARPALAARKPHVKLERTAYWKGLYRDRVVVKLVDGADLDLRPGPTSGAKTKLVTSSPQKRASHQFALDLNAINALLAEDAVVQMPAIVQRRPRDPPRATGHRRTADGSSACAFGQLLSSSAQARNGG